MHNELIDNVILRPGMYFGGHEGYLRDLVAMDLGYSMRAGFDEERMDFKERLIPDSFVRFVCSRLEGGQALSWSTRIEIRSAGEKEAWEMFCALWAEFRSMPSAA